MDAGPGVGIAEIFIPQTKQTFAGIVGGILHSIYRGLKSSGLSLERRRTTMKNDELNNLCVESDLVDWMRSKRKLDTENEGL